QWMEYFYRSARNPSPPCMHVIAPGGGGKSAMMKGFADRYPVIAVPGEPSRLKRPVLLADCLNAGEGPKGLAHAIIRAAWPGLDCPERFRTIDYAEETLRVQGTRVLILDEAAEVLLGGPTKHKQVINLIKQINTRLSINVVTATVHGLEYAFAADAQMSSRFAKRFDITAWKRDSSFRDFLAGLQRFLPFERPSGLEGRTKLYALHRASEGNMRKLVNTVRVAALWAVSEGSSHIDDAHIR